MPGSIARKNHGTGRVCHPSHHHRTHFRMRSQRFLLRCSKSCAMLISPERSDGNLLEQFDRAIPRLFGYVYPCNEQRSELIRFQWGSGLAGDR